MNIGFNPSQITQALPGFNKESNGLNLPKSKEAQEAKGFGDLLLRKYEASQKTMAADLRPGGVVGDVIRAVDAKEKMADATRTAFLAGESGNLHQTMIASQEASLSFSLMVEMRNKVLEAYQELMRIQI